jgi:hypothetical protein
MSLRTRTRLSFLELETRENPSVPIAPPFSSGAPATTTPSPTSASNGGATSPGGGQTTSSGTVTVTTTNSNNGTPTPTNPTGTGSTGGLLNLGNNVSGQPLLESSLVNN